MASAFLIPIVTWLPKGYACTIVMPPAALVDVVRPQGGVAEQYWRVSAGGTVVDEGADEIVFGRGRIESAPSHWLTCRAALAADWPEDGGFLEYGVRAKDDTPLFAGRRLPSFYNIYSGERRKGFVTCHTWKFGSPQVISQIALFGRYVDAYSVIHIDRRRNLGDSLILVNPYKKPVLAQLLASDGQRPARQRVPALGVHRLDLGTMLAEGRDEWIGQVQLTANNRLITHIVKHSLSDPTVISAVEHLDPFRADPTHMPGFQWLRNQYGEWAARRRARHA
ncbi:MAG: hypothetical protein R3F55_23810 [Alphaproteobacteria bacterium]